MTTHTDACQLIESVSELARLGWAVKHRASQGAVEFTLADLEEIAHALTHADLAHAVDKGGDTLDGPIVLSDEPTGDAMRWTSCLPSLGDPCGTCHRCAE